MAQPYNPKGFSMNCSKPLPKHVQELREKKENCPTCGAPVKSIFDHVDGCPEPKTTKGTKPNE